MPDNVYSVIALAARYWFLFVMVLIVWHSYSWFNHERKIRKKSLRNSPYFGIIGELVLLTSVENYKQGTSFPVPKEGTLGTLKINDIVINDPSVCPKHLYFNYEENTGIFLSPLTKIPFFINETAYANKKVNTLLTHNDTLEIGNVSLRLFLYSNLNKFNHSPSLAQNQLPPISPEQWAMWQAYLEQMQHQIIAQQSKQEELQPENTPQLENTPPPDNIPQLDNTPPPNTNFSATSISSKTEQNEISKTNNITNNQETLFANYQKIYAPQFDNENENLEVSQSSDNSKNSPSLGGD